MEALAAMIALARHNIKINPQYEKFSAEKMSNQYLVGLADEVAEVRDELKKDNTVYLTDELSDIMWDYAVLLAMLEHYGWIDSIEDVFEHGAQKYQERSAAFPETDDVLWDKIKAKQKEQLHKKHKLLYGN